MNAFFESENVRMPLPHLTAGGSQYLTQRNVKKDTRLENRVSF